MIGPRGIGIVGRVAGEALDRRQSIFKRGHLAMAPGTIHRRMNPDEWEQRRAVDLEHLTSVVPSCRYVAVFAAKSQLADMGILMAVRTCRRHQREVESLMTTGAGHRSMTAGQREAGRTMLELKRVAEGLPTLEGVTFGALPLEGAMRTLLCSTLSG